MTGASTASKTSTARRQVSRAGAAALLIVGLLVPAVPAQAAAMTVAAGIVTAGNDGACSLREAITNANADAQTFADCPAGSGADVITLPAGTYQVDDPLRAGEGSDSAFQIKSDVTLIGAGNVVRFGATPTILDAGSIRRHFQVHPAGSLQLQDLRLEDGSTPGSGGAILNEGNVHAVRVGFVDNHAAEDGGAVANLCPSGSGGAPPSCAAVLSADGTSFSQNSATDRGGAIYSGKAFGSASDSLTDISLVSSTLSANQAEDGSAVFSESGSTTIDRSVVAHNAGIGRGSDAVAIVNQSQESQGTLSLMRSTIHDNAGSGLLNSGGSATILDSTISDNAGQRGGGVQNLAYYICFSIGSGGDCLTAHASMTIRDSTVTGNTAFGADSGGGIWSSDRTNDNSGGGFNPADLTLTNVTVAGNSSPSGAQVRASGAQVRNTVIANSSGVGDCDQTDDDISWSGHHNLSDDFSCGTGGFSKVANTLLHSLADNGGPTLTHMPLPDSPVINAGHQATCDEGSKPGGGHRSARHRVPSHGWQLVRHRRGRSGAPEVPHASGEGETVTGA